MEKWIHANLSGLLDFPVPEDLSKYILQIENERDLDEYLKSLLDYGNPKHKQFIADLKKRQATHNDQAGYKKTNDNDNVTKRQNEKKKGKAKSKENVQPQEPVKLDKVDKRKTKFVNLYSQEGRDRATILLKGRHKCNCEARKHALINNCRNCGRIVCIQEGAGPCFFCGELVCSPEQQAILLSNTKQADTLYNKLMDQKPSKSLEESLKQRDKLLEYDRNSSRRTKVIDDESDYYQCNSVWLSAAERERLQKQEEEISARKHQSRFNRKITLDFAGREVVEEDDLPNDEFYDQELQEFCEQNLLSEQESGNICPSIEFSRPMYIEAHNSKQHAKNSSHSFNLRNIIQDKEYLEITDNGLCLSMHQPYATLLTAGIKIHEGRTWYSAHRGRLWIASAAKAPTIDEINTVQHFYRVLKDEKIKFPESYPTSALLGCVTVTDVLSQEEYKKIYPEGESDSPYVFICENPYMLPIKFPIQGKHKIYKLDPKIHQAALKSLEKAMRNLNK